MTLRFAIGFALLLVLGGLGLASSITGLAMVEAVNLRLAPREQFDSFGWWAGKTQRLYQEYRRLYPDGGLIRRQAILSAGMLACLLLVALFLGFDFLQIAFFGSVGLLILVVCFRHDFHPRKRGSD